MAGKRTVVGSMQPRRSSSTISSPSSTSRPPPKNRDSSTPTRSTRSTGKAEHYVELVGSPKMAEMERRKAAAAHRKRQIKQDSDSGDEQEERLVTDSEDEIMLKVETPKKTPIKKQRTTYLPSPARSTASTSSPQALDSDSSSDEDQVEKMLIDTPRRKRAAPAKQLITPESTPLKKRATSSVPKTSSPLKKSTAPSKRRASIVLNESEEDEEKEDEQPRKTPTKAKVTPSKITPSKVTPSAPRLSRSDSTTPSRSSLRNQRLPPDLSQIKNAPAVLRNRLVGFHMEDEGYGVNPETETREDSESEEEEDEEVVNKRRQAKGKGRALEVDESEQNMEGEETDPFVVTGSRPLEADEDYTLPTPPSTYSAAPEVTSQPIHSAYPSSLLYTHLHRQLSILTGSTLPEARLSPDASSPKFDPAKGVMGYPFLEGGYQEWEKPLRGCLDEVVTRGMGNAVVLLGPRGVGKTMVSVQILLTFLPD